jgi:4-hydroxybenzoate polyprenyltransferase
LTGIKSTAILFGDDDRMIIGIFQFCFVGIMLLIANQLTLGISFYLAILATIVLFAYQQIITKKRERAQCLHAFLNNNWVGAALFIGTVVHYSLM